MIVFEKKRVPVLAPRPFLVIAVEEGRGTVLTSQPGTNQECQLAAVTNQRTSIQNPPAWFWAKVEASPVQRGRRAGRCPGL